MNGKPSRLSTGLVLAAGSCLFALAASVVAQEREVAGLVPVASSAELRPEAYGTADLTMIQVAAAQCKPVNGTTSASGANGYFYATGGARTFDCPIDFPAGAKPVRLDAVVHDADDTGSVYLIFEYCEGTSTTGCTPWAATGSSGTAAAPFTGYLHFDVSGYPLLVDKTARFYFVRVLMGTAGSTNQFREVDVYYQRQVSAPVPGTQTFGDVPAGHPFYKAIEALSASGITGGCGGGNFCPAGNVTRGELAAFLARALGLHFPN
jgi:hypothetical protein